MSDDIVTRLRYYKKYLMFNPSEPNATKDLVDAADEIERLRKENWELAKYIADFLHTVRNG